MNLNKTMTLLMIGLTFAGYASRAGAETNSATTMDAMTSLQGCHVLMTETECGSYLNTLATLPPGEARDRFLLAHRAMISERIVSCNCNRIIKEPVVFPYNQRVLRQAMRQM